ncbi:hypothetical protein BKA56DRAFT_731289 [Ilyonectria sp. MPI-CAGE-AT-0026]|nr:hypothetical protein BKA56DRAFT_731289 [Ilyonectria sp. MPI-CAGE-AT-0026]
MSSSFLDSNLDRRVDDQEETVAGDALWDEGLNLDIHKVATGMLHPSEYRFDNRSPEPPSTHTHFSSSTCFVLDDGSGTAAGYWGDCPSVDAFIAAYALHVTAVLDASPEVHPRPDPLKPPEPWTSAEGSVNAASLAQLAYDPHRLAPVTHTDVPPRFRATLHIDLLEPWQAKGWRGKLLERLVGARGAV